ncbi:endospore germination permease [Paenibacillus sp.]|uniref:GerAB/ArcD/ProY family transporter n=1 Tax=Paenibacillus sp. TaxID=58172 RepID=UPI002811BC75|nr:endospore germination permease [Paenibacillus sp.]
MKSADEKITVRQFQILIILGVIGDSILIMPMIMASYAKQDAWLSMLIATGAGLALGGLFAAAANKLRRADSLIEASRKTLGGWLGSLVGLLFLFNFFMCSLTLLSEMSQFMTTQLMPETPINAIILIFLLVVILAYRYGIEAFSRMSELLFPAFVALFLFLVVLLLPQAEFPNLQPIAANGFIPVFEAAFQATTVSFAEMVVLLSLAPHVSGDRKLTKPIITSFLIGGVFLFTSVSLCVLVLGPNLMETKYYPTFVLAQKLTIGNFLERMEAIIAFLWMITVFYKTLLLFYAVTAGIAHLFKLRESRMLTVPLGMIMLVLTVVGTPNIAVYNQIIKRYYPFFDVAFCILLPGLLLVGLAFERRKG